MIIFLTGADSFRLAKRLGVLKQGFQKKYDQKKLNIAILDGANLTMDNFRLATRSAGLFAKKRLIIIKNIFNNRQTELFESIAKDIDRKNDDNILIFTCTESLKDKNNPLLKKLRKADKVEEFPLLKAGQIYHFIQEEIKKKKALIDNDAVNYLVEAIGDDLWLLNNELNILSSYTKKITQKDAELFITSPLDENIFNFMDALSAKNTPLAIKLLHDQLDSGANEFYLLTMLFRQIKILIQVKETNGQGLALHPFVIKKSLNQVKKFSLEKLKKLFAELTAIDQKLKSSQGSPAVLLDLFVVRMCQQKAPN